MPLQIVRNDITKMNVDAIVNAANSSLMGGGGVDGAIHAAAGPRLHLACRKLGGCQPGDAKITKGYRLPCKYIIHTVGPVWQGGQMHEAEILASCYRRSLELAIENKCATVAFPLISSGAYGYPKEEALEIAIQEISRFLLQHELLVYLVVYGRDSFHVSKKLIDEIVEYIDDCYVEAYDYGVSTVLSTQPLGDAPTYAPAPIPTEAVESSMQAEKSVRRRRNAPGAAQYSQADYASLENMSALEDTANLADMLAMIDESFSQMLLRKIDERGITDAECYKKANVDRKLFSKIRSNVNYKPSKPTAIAFAISLELDMRETEELLRKAGYALSHSNKFDIIIEYFIRRGNYNIFEINEALFAFDQSLLGA